MNDFNISTLSEEDISQVVNIHIESFNGFFLTTLGYSFLHCYYSSVIRNEDSICVGIFDKNKLIGFAVGTIKPVGFHKKLFLKNFKLFLPYLFKYIFKPKVILRLLLNLQKGSKREINNYAELLSIAVNKNFMGKGWGKILLKEFERQVLKNNFKNIILTTDYYNNEYTMNFYKNNGYSVFDIFITYPKRKMYKMIKRF